jgi:hypothetical protein
MTQVPRLTLNPGDLLPAPLPDDHGDLARGQAGRSAGELGPSRLDPGVELRDHVRRQSGGLLGVLGAETALQLALPDDGA